MLRVRLDFDYDGTGAPDFSTPGDDISAWVQSATTRLGAESGDLVARVGVGEITLINTDRRFSPAISDDYPGALRPGKPILLEWLDGATTYPLFRGFVQSITPTPDRYGRRTAVIRCLDWMGILQAAPLELPLREQVRSDVLLRDVVNLALDAPAASGRFDFTANPAHGESVTVNGTMYTFKSAISAPNDVLIGANRRATADHLLAAINGWEGAGTTYHLSTLRPALVRAMHTPGYFRTVLEDEPVRYYRLGEASGTAASDAGSNAAAGTYAGVTLGADGALTNDPDSAVSFDGSDDYVALPTLDFKRRSFTLEAWIKPSASPPSQQAVIGVFSGAGVREEMVLEVDASGVLFVYFSGPEVVATAPGAISFGAGWHHVACVHDASTSLTTLYVDGTFAAAGSTGAFEGVRPVLSIGVSLPPFIPFKGSIDEVALYLHAVPPARIAAHYAAFSVPFGLTLVSTLKGSSGGSATISDASAAITTSGTALTGGLDFPAAQHNYEAGTQTFDYAGDQWTGQFTTAYEALRDVVHSEQGRLFTTRSGTLMFESGEAKFKDHTLPPVLSVGAADEIVDLYGSQTDAAVRNSIRVEFSPRSTISSGVVARINAAVKVPGKWGRLNSDPNLNIVVNPGGGQTVISLPFIDPDTGEAIGAKDLILPPEAVTDWTANERADGLGVEYTAYSPPQLFFTIAQKASGVDVFIRNIALGPLYIRKLQLRGTRITRYDRQAAVREDVPSIRTYGRRSYTAALPLLSDANTAVALAEYLLGRYAASRYRISRATLRNLRILGGINAFSVEIGDAVALSEYQTTPTSPVPKLRVSGIDYEFAVGGTFTVTWHLEPIDDITYGVYDAGASLYDQAHYGV